MRSFIFGTDWGEDCDDVVALRILARKHKAGEIKLLGIAINTCIDESAASLDAFLASEGVELLPIGIDRSATELCKKITYQKRLATSGKARITNADAEDGVNLYRRILAEATEPIEIIEVGFLQVLAGLLESEADEISPLDGIELVRTKVAKIWSMAGKFDEDGGREYNIHKSELTRKAADTVVKKCPVPITFLGFEIGFPVITGGDAVLKEGDVLLDAMRDYGNGHGRNSWDPMTALLAVIGDEEKAGYNTVHGTVSVDIATGANYFAKSENGLHAYVVKKFDDTYYAEAINKIIA
ncbi:MAG: hypothetical protein IJW79_07960 [Clostridia bacterium]|nr:hypothetical protein [Clostridia bacterium]